VRGLGEVLRMLGRYAEAVDALEEAVEYSVRADDPLGRAKALLDLGNCHRIVHLDELAQSELEQALKLYTAAEDDFERARTLRALGNLHRQRGECDAAEAVLTEALVLFEQFEARPGDSYWVACTRYSLGKLLRDQGRPGEASDEFEGARLAFGDGPGSRLWRARLDRQLAQVWLADEKRRDEAEELAVSALNQFLELGVPFWEAHARHTLGQILALRADRREDARRELRRASELYTEVGNSWCAADAAAHLAEIYPLKDTAGAIRMMRAAIGTFGQFDDRRRQLEALKALEVLETLDSDRGGRRRTLMSAPAAPDPTDHRIAS
jgi:tetratricopeptide (TPR) repeat protein